MEIGLGCSGYPPPSWSSLELLVLLVTLVQKCDRVIKTPIFSLKIIGFFGVFHTFEDFEWKRWYIHKNIGPEPFNQIPLGQARPESEWFSFKF